MEYYTARVTLVTLIKNYFKERNLPYEIVPNASDDGRESGVRLRGGITGRIQDDWLGWIYETEFKTFNWGTNKTTGIIKKISAFDPEFFTKLEAWLPECVVMWQKEQQERDRSR